jgi:hypothetical protein
VQDQLQQLAQRQLKADEEPSDLRRSLAFALRELGKTATILQRQIGGMVTRRDGAGSGRDLLEPLPSARQRQALELLIQSFLSTDSVRVPPTLQRRLVPDYLERADASHNDSAAAVSTDFSVAEMLLQRQREVLSFLMHEGLADRLADNQDKVRDREANALNAYELHQRIQKAVWSPSKTSSDQGSWQRNLQREYVNRLSVMLLRGASSRADTRAAIREQAKTTVAQLKGQHTASANKSEVAAWQAHRQDCLDTLERALQASVIRTTP